MQRIIIIIEKKSEKKNDSICNHTQHFLSTFVCILFIIHIRPLGFPDNPFCSLSGSIFYGDSYLFLFYTTKKTLFHKQTIDANSQTYAV